MIKTLLQILFGFISGSIGTYLGFLFLTGIADGPEIIFAILAFLLITIAIILFIRSAKSNAIIGVQQIKITTDGKNQEKGFEQMIERNNAMEQSWGKTTKTRDQLKVLQAAQEE
ncbi:MAG TPA: hypothetical protein VLF20_04050 [Patescibacteria group bacterium]|nr:hypothetical protein [Patescibacteria group bacterium]